jgi:dolichol-phosphate mannosyltransferase
MSSVSIIIPTYNEKKNIVKLLQLIKLALTKVKWEVIFVDDNSPDGTSKIIKRELKNYSNVKLITRINKRGLAGAVIEGLKEAKNKYIVVMDGDLQHNPEVINVLLKKIETTNHSIVIASRFYKKSKTEVLSKFRLIGSKIAIKLCRFITGFVLTDSMSGFFIIRKNLFVKYSDKLSMDGYKILIDLILHIPKQNKVSEVSLDFQKRYSGESKLNFYILWDFILVLINNYTKKIIPRKYISYFCVGFIGLFFHTIVLWFLHKILVMEFIYSHLIATITAISINYFFNNILTFYDRKLHKFKYFIYGYLKYHLLCSYGAFISFSIAKTLFEFNIFWMLCGLTGILTASVWNFTVSSFYVWKKN